MRGNSMRRIEKQLADARTGRNGRHALVGLLRQSVFGRLAGYEDVRASGRHQFRQERGERCVLMKAISELPTSGAPMLPAVGACWHSG
jgi:hypothetical protein